MPDQDHRVLLDRRAERGTKRGSSVLWATEPPTGASYIDERPLRDRRRAVAIVIGLLLVCGVVVALVETRSSDDTVTVVDDGTSTSVVTEPSTTTPADLTQEREAILADKQAGERYGYNMINPGAYAYPSQPIDITAPGEYETLVGPVDDWVHYELTLGQPLPLDNSPSAWMIKQRGDQTFDVQPHEIHTVESDGQRYLAVKFTVAEQRPGFLTPYYGYRFWLY